MNKATINSVLFIVSDLERSKAFYQKVFDVEPQQFAPNLASLDVNGLLLQLNGDATAPWVPPKAERGGGVGVHFGVDDIQAVWDRLHTLGISLPEKPTQRPWGLTTFVITDPDGYEVQFQQPINAAS